jgi:C4-dicarboxylate transporter DctQ subunit
LRAALHRVEESLIAVILGVMTILTFVQVVLRYGFNSGFIWALEADFYDTPRWVMHDGTTLTCSVRQ